jgi:hypothetical protein
MPEFHAKTLALNTLSALFVYSIGDGTAHFDR